MSQSLGCMQLNENHVPFLTFPRLDVLPYITHAFSTRKAALITGIFFYEFKFQSR
ncbi:MAG: hypothetical protein ACLRX7_07745 [Acutalibacteraceae bacterium]